MKRSITLLSALALCATQALGQQILYYDISDVTLHEGDAQTIQVDSPITAIITSSQSGLTIQVSSSGVSASSNTNCEVLMNGSSPAALQINSIIGPTASWQAPSNMMLADASGGNWYNVSERFLGVRIKEAGLWYYGWIRMDVHDTGNIFTTRIYDYACNAEQGDSVYAGEVMGSGTAVSHVAAPNTGIKSICINKKLSFAGLNNTGYVVCITDMSGRTRGRYNYTGEPIDLSGYIPGIYIVTLEDDKLKRRFKIAL